MREAHSMFIESQDKSGLRWLIRVIRAGLSGNRNYYPDAVLCEAVPLFEGTRVFVKSDDEHLAGGGKSFHNLIGRLISPTFVEGRGEDSGEIRAVFELLDTAGQIPAKIREAWQRGMTQGLFGFSIDAVGTYKAYFGKRSATKITSVNSVDLIIEPGAGGELINMLEAYDKRQEEDMHIPEPYKNRLTKRQFVPGLDRRDKVDAMLNDFFDGKIHSFKECYVEMTGDRRVTGRSKDCDQVRLREALGSGDLPSVLGNAIGRRMVMEYRDVGLYDIWRKVAAVKPINDFRTQHHVRFGGYGDLPTVAQGQAYTALVSPTDEDATYALSKRGGTESINLEAIKNDDVGLIRSVPGKLAKAAKRTLAKFVLDFFRINPVVYDGVALFHATHGNLGAAALSAAAVAAARAAMQKQRMFGSDDQAGSTPKTLLVPFDLEEAGHNLFRRAANIDKTFVQSLAMDVVPVWYWADPNDWVIAADPGKMPIIEVGFLDGNEDPELFVQDAPSGGSLFSHDQLTWKIRHIYGGTPVEYRGVYKSVVV